MAVPNLDDIKAHLNIDDVKHDDKLRDFIEAAVAAIGERVGPLAPEARTVRVRPAGRGLRVPSPAISLTSVTGNDGAEVTISDLYLAPTGLISLEDGGALTARFYTVTYMAGRDPIPADLVLAVKELVRHFWDTQRGPTVRPGAGRSDSAANSVPGAAYTFPFRVSELLKPHLPLLVGV